MTSSPTAHPPPVLVPAHLPLSTNHPSEKKIHPSKANQRNFLLDSQPNTILTNGVKRSTAVKTPVQKPPHEPGNAHDSHPKPLHSHLHLQSPYTIPTCNIPRPSKVLLPNPQPIQSHPSITICNPIETPHRSHNFPFFLAFFLFLQPPHHIQTA